MISRINLRKDVQIGLRLNEDEYLKVNLLAKYHRLSKSSYINELIKDFSDTFKRHLSVGKRERQISVRLSEVDFQILESKASEEGVSLQNYIRMLIHSVTLPHNIDDKIVIKTK